MEKRMQKAELIEVIESLKIDKDEFWILSSGALVLRDILEDAGDLDIAVTAKGLEQLKSKYNLKQKENGFYIVTDKIECVVDTKEEWKIEKCGEYNLESIGKYYAYLKSSTREKDIARIPLVEEYMKKENKQEIKRATRVIIEDGNDLIFIKRTKKINGSPSVYYVLPGGHLDENETWEEAGIRECMEELSVNVEIEGMLAEEYSSDLNKLERFYFAHIVSGKLKIGTEQEMKDMSIDTKYGLFEIARISKKEIGAYKILPVSIKDKLVATYV